jgi:hypothetical protein
LEFSVDFTLNPSIEHEAIVGVPHVFLAWCCWPTSGVAVGLLGNMFCPKKMINRFFMVWPKTCFLDVYIEDVSSHKHDATRCKRWVSLSGSRFPRLVTKIENRWRQPVFGTLEFCCCKAGLHPDVSW